MSIPNQDFHHGLLGTRTLAAALRDGFLEGIPLNRVIRMQVEKCVGRMGLEYDLELPGPDVTLEGRLQEAAARILREALTNVTSHARATHVLVRARIESEHLEMQVVDDGIGITDDQLVSPECLGLIGIRERALALGGCVEIRRRTNGTGTVVTVKLPLPATGTNRKT